MSTSLLAWTIDAASARRDSVDETTAGWVGMAAVQALQSDGNGITFELLTGPYVAEDDGRIEVAGLSHRIQEPGAPDLPYYSTLIALPPEANVVGITLLDASVTQNHVGQVQPVRQLAADSLTRYGESEDELEGTVPPSASLPFQAHHFDASIYGRDAVYPGSRYSLSEPMYYRDLRLVELRLYPIRYNPVDGTVHQVERMQLALDFSGPPSVETRAAPSQGDAHVQALSGLVLNFEQAKAWRALPAASARTAAVTLPIGVDSYKILVDRDGIYELSGAELAAAGMIISQVNPSDVQMMNRGKSVATQFIGDNDTVLEPNERFRFFGWAFNGPRSEKQFVSDNVFWLWSGSGATSILTRTNEAGMGHDEVKTFQSTVTREPENVFFGSWTLWDGYPNEPDAWFWERIRKGAAPLTNSYTITLPYPATNGADATYLAELNSRSDLQHPSPPHLVKALINSSPSTGSMSWYGIANVNVSNTVPISEIHHGSNDVKLVIATGTFDQLFLNRISVLYERRLMADNDQLLFADDVAGAREFHISGMFEGDASRALVLDVTDPLKPVQVEVESANVISGTSAYTYTIGSSQTVTETRYLVTTLNNILTASQISRYVPLDLEPASDRATWLAITHQDFFSEANRLADHRASPGFGRYFTHVVDVEHVINQYGYGLPLPEAIRSYLSHAMNSWSIAPSYVLLMGDATQNPRGLDCPLTGSGPNGSCFAWDKDEPNYVLTDLVFKDRFQGMIPSDHTFVLLSGDDLLPDMSIGRIAAQSSTEARAVVDKIITFEQNQLINEQWQKNVLFVADNADSGGDFCSANQGTGNGLPTVLNQTHLCLDPSGPISTTAILTPLMASAINSSGVTILNYRGHGSLDSWAKEFILSTDDTEFWDNSGKPVVILSADCLDGYFAWPGAQGLGEVFLKLDDAGSAAHWSSTGLGFTGEHSVLHRALYDGLYDMDLTAIGDAINYSKLYYDSLGHDESELYSFTLQGDPAMRLVDWTKELYLPLIVGD